MHARITLEGRYAIDVMRKHHYSIRAIARKIGGAPSTISRELRRNLRPTGRCAADTVARCVELIGWHSGKVVNDHV